MIYDEEIPDFGDLFTVELFRQYVTDGSFIDYDGYGYPVKDGKMSRVHVIPSEVEKIPSDATHIMWFNR